MLCVCVALAVLVRVVSAKSTPRSTAALFKAEYYVSVEIWGEVTVYVPCACVCVRVRMVNGSILDTCS